MMIRSAARGAVAAASVVCVGVSVTLRSVPDLRHALSPSVGGRALRGHSPEVRVRRRDERPVAPPEGPRVAAWPYSLPSHDGDRGRPSEIAGRFAGSFRERRCRTGTSRRGRTGADPGPRADHGRRGGCPESGRHPAGLGHRRLCRRVDRRPAGDVGGPANGPRADRPGYGAAPRSLDRDCRIETPLAGREGGGGRRTPSAGPRRVEGAVVGEMSRALAPRALSSMASPARPLCVVRRPSRPAAAHAAANRRLIWVTPRPITRSAGAGDSAACSRRTAAAQPATKYRMLAHLSSGFAADRRNVTTTSSLAVARNADSWRSSLRAPIWSQFQNAADQAACAEAVRLVQDRHPAHSALSPSGQPPRPNARSGDVVVSALASKEATVAQRRRIGICTLILMCTLHEQARCQPGLADTGKCLKNKV